MDRPAPRSRREIASFDSMKDLVPFMRDGICNPGQLVAVREILPGSGGFDTAVYNNPLNDPATGLPNSIINIDDARYTHRLQRRYRHGAGRQRQAARWHRPPHPHRAADSSRDQSVVPVPGAQ